uniref:Glutamate--cysteine ligase n=1 Tax=Nosema pernyi TaxID=1112939 RepID=A0A0N7ABJ9_9MICR|nr:glutamate-cysteine ligase [Nosema pernyi]
MDIQATVFENTALIYLSFLLSEAILLFDLNLYIPISLVDENFKRANAFIKDPSDYKKINLKEDNQLFYYRRNVLDKGKPEIKEGTLKEIFLGDGECYKEVLAKVKGSKAVGGSIKGEDNVVGGSKAVGSIKVGDKSKGSSKGEDNVVGGIKVGDKSKGSSKGEDNVVGSIKVGDKSKGSSKGEDNVVGSIKVGDKSKGSSKGEDNVVGGSRVEDNVEGCEMSLDLEGHNPLSSNSPPSPINPLSSNNPPSTTNPHTSNLPYHSTQPTHNPPSTTNLPYKGLFHFIYLLIDQKYKSTNLKIYIQFLENKLKNQFISLGDWIRKFVINHRDYKGDSVVSDKIINELIEKLIEIRKKNDIEYLRNL